MKTVKSICIALFLFTISSNAQINKGNWMVGGYANFSNTSYESKNPDGSTNKGKASGINVSPTIGYFLANNFACGLSGNFVLSIPEQGNNVTSYGLGPFFRYYFLKPEKTINILSQVGYYYGTSSNDSKYNNYNFKVGPVIYFNNSVGLELTIDYSVSKSSNQFSQNTFNSLNIGFGFQIHLEK
ncbi:hypothetical protein QWY90_14265 [Flavobacterium paronense]|uniref:Outer membrane protein beta-barrel domain-containing protein n=1 Tax=Flavobacterium paronense TaxID=1392775 RepID=A0ABV5GEZ4_9FLAO|nr:hypothetical protein [Flavobacterium paronense]MDN3678475.1 hypothetical protein [Flavobacterium paronense]